jgi:hypothetical protein
MFTVIGVILIGIFIISSIIEYLKKNNLKTKGMDPDDLPVNLPSLSKETKLDYDIHRVLSSDLLYSGVGPGSNSATRAYIRNMIVEEIMLRVKPEYLKPEFLEEKTQKQKEILEKKKPLLEAIRKIIADNGISEEWLLKNGGFEKAPYRLPEISAGDIKLAGDQLSDVLRWRQLQELKYEREAFATYTHHAFGNELPYSLLEEVPDKDLELMIKYKDRLITKFNSAPEPKADDKYRP